MNIPNFLCIGVCKAGTTILIKYLNLHPDIYCNSGEKHFFDKVPYTKNLSEEECKKYADWFKTEKKIVGEKTPSYCYLQFAVDRIHKYNPNMKLILILREPISRAYSQYNMKLNKEKKYKEKSYMSEFNKEKNVKLSEITRNGDYYIVRGFYYEIIKYILSKFDRRNLYICISDEIIKNKEIEYNKIYKFLGASTRIKINKDLDVHKLKYKNKIPKDLEIMLYKIYKPHNEKLYELLGRKIDIWEKYYETI
tara:strand:+ start:2174 stop:2926 length:753 start_codon:yes stop_codon:yes gene_type:complete